MTDNGNEALHHELKLLIVEALQLEDTKAEAISTTAALFGDGLNLDSIDALELATALERKYGVKLSQENKEAFRSVGHLAEHIAQHRS